MKILITGSEGFIGKNLSLRLSEENLFSVISLIGHEDDAEIEHKVQQSDFIIHLAGVNRTNDENDFEEINHLLTKKICNLASKAKKPPHIIFPSSIQVKLDNPYGKSKLLAEKCLVEYSKISSSRVAIYRLPNVFGKWGKPNYHSVIATFCNNIARGLPIEIHQPDKELQLLYVDDVITQFINYLKEPNNDTYQEIKAIYKVKLKSIATKLKTFKDSRNKLEIDTVGKGFNRALYATYISYLEPEDFVYEVTAHNDSRGSFVEVLKTKDSGQFSFFTAYPGVTRGGHYHNTKTEKFIVIQGKALFRFRSLETGEYKEIITSEDKSAVVESIPGWTHDITNIGNSKMIVMLWANEIFDQENPDTYSSEI